MLVLLSNQDSWSMCIVSVKLLEVCRVLDIDAFTFKLVGLELISTSVQKALENKYYWFWIAFNETLEIHQHLPLPLKHLNYNIDIHASEDHYDRRQQEVRLLAWPLKKNLNSAQYIYSPPATQRIQRCHPTGIRCIFVERYLSNANFVKIPLSIVNKHYRLIYSPSTSQNSDKHPAPKILGENRKYR